ncbi:TPA: hypothetical protein MO340_004284 [Salmonella enterica subsp. salamae serovar 35:g,m,s,t:-]|nr:hypothetical protein [Salmonella enterica subsp. salamae serovar 35:g,m,s,t:-]HCA3549754.1 hypothetical protein [Salmonella enterica subsp. salamae serovar 35:g,m,s,t:-]
MSKFSNTHLNPKGYAVNNTTLASFAGMFFLGVTAIILTLNAIGCFFASVWMYFFDGYSFTNASMIFLLATPCIAASLLCREGYLYCLNKLRQHELQN